MSSKPVLKTERSSHKLSFAIPTEQSQTNIQEIDVNITLKSN